MFSKKNILLPRIQIFIILHRKCHKLEIFFLLFNISISEKTATFSGFFPHFSFWRSKLITIWRTYSALRELLLFFFYFNFYPVEKNNLFDAFIRARGSDENLIKGLLLYKAHNAPIKLSEKPNWIMDFSFFFCKKISVALLSGVQIVIIRETRLIIIP